MLECHHSMFRERYRSLRDRASRRYLRFLKRQLSLPVSMMSQWWVGRSRSAVVILLSPKHGGPIGEGQIGGDYALRFSNRAPGITLSGVKGGWR